MRLFIIVDLIDAYSISPENALLALMSEDPKRKVQVPRHQHMGAIINSERIL
jgi:hypothetical protein